jgi:hypothetical protein
MAGVLADKPGEVRDLEKTQKGSHRCIERERMTKPK